MEKGKRSGRRELMVETSKVRSVDVVTEAAG